MKDLRNYFIEERKELLKYLSSIDALLAKRDSNELFGEYQCLLMEKQKKALEDSLSALNEMLLFNRIITTRETDKEFNLLVGNAANEDADNTPQTQSSDRFLDGVTWMSKYMDEHYSIEKSKKEKVIDAIYQLNRNRAPLFYFENKDVDKIAYWYNSESDSLETQYVSLSLSNYKTKDITPSLIDKLLYDLESLVIEYFKKEKGIILETFDE